MVDVLTILVTGAMISSVYALIAIGFSLIYGVRGVINLSHGALIMIGAFVLSWVALGLLYLFVRRTKLGRSILATSMSEKGAKLNGVNVLYVNAATWLVAGAFAGFSGVFLGSLQSTSPTMWVNALGLAFIIVTIGGVGSIKGTIIAAYLIGFLETLTVTFVGAQWRGMFALLLLIGIIIARPQGLFGREFIE